MLVAFAVSMVLAADPPPASSETMKGLVKDAVTTPDGGDGPDVSKLPFSPESIRMVVAHYQPRIQGCYEEYLAGVKVKKAPEGRLLTNWIITPDGIVKSAKVNRKGSALKDPGLHDCVVAVISTMSFPRPSDQKDQPIEFPFNLKAVH